MSAPADNKKFHRRFSVGYNGSPDFFDSVVLPYRGYISSVYSTPVLASGVSSARFVPDVKASDLLRLRRRLGEAGIEFNLVYNFDGAGDDRLLPRLVKTAASLEPDLLTVNGTYILDEFLRLGRYKLNISVINDINSLNQLHQLLERDPRGLITSYNVGRRKTWDLAYIASVRRAFPRLGLKLMVNEGCVFECPDQNFHSCSMSMAPGSRVDQSRFYCGKLAPDQRWRFFTGQFIPPKFLGRWLGLVDEFKLATRGVHGWPVSDEFITGLLDDYIAGADVTLARGIQAAFGGTLFLRGNDPAAAGEEFLKPYPADFFGVRSACRHDCWRCRYCRDLVRPARRPRPGK